MNKTKEHYHSLLKVTTFRVSPSSGKITKLSQKKSHLRRNEKRDLSEHQHQRLPTSEKRKKKNGMKKYTQSKHQSKKSVNQKTIKVQKPFHRKNGKLHVEKPGDKKTNVALATTK